MREIEVASKLPFTAIINNSNLGDLTCEEDILKSGDYISQLSKLSGLPVIMTTSVIKTNIEDNFNIELQDKYYAI